MWDLYIKILITISQIVSVCIIHIYLFLIRSHFQALVAWTEFSTRPSGCWPGAIMSPSGNVTGLMESDTHLSVLGSFGCYWTLAGCRSLPRRDAGGPSVMVQPVHLASFCLHTEKKVCVRVNSPNMCEHMTFYSAPDFFNCDAPQIFKNFHLSCLLASWILLCININIYQSVL